MFRRKMLPLSSRVKDYCKIDTMSNLDIIFEKGAWWQHIPLHHLFTYKTINHNPDARADNPHSKNLKINIEFKVFRSSQRCNWRPLFFWQVVCHWVLPNISKERVAFIILWNAGNHLKVTLVWALRLCTGCMAHRRSRDIALLFHGHGTRRGWGVSITPQSLFIPWKEPVPIAQEDGWAPGPVWTGAENLASPTGIRSPDRPARSQLLYSLRYPAHGTPYTRYLISTASWTLSQPQGLLCILVLFFWDGKLYVSIHGVSNIKKTSVKNLNTAISSPDVTMSIASHIEYWMGRQVYDLRTWCYYKMG